jgi:hypothetical protein
MYLEESIEGGFEFKLSFYDGEESAVDGNGADAAVEVVIGAIFAFFRSWRGKGYREISMRIFCFKIGSSFEVKLSFEVTSASIFGVFLVQYMLVDSEPMSCSA